MSKIDSAGTLEKLKDCFSRFGLPSTVVSDNGTRFVSQELSEFCKLNNIIHTRTALYHPASNGAAENAVKTFKNSLKRYLCDSDCNLSISVLLSKYLFSYRNTPHCSTGETPSKLMLNRRVKTRLDFLKVTASQKAIENQVKYFHGSRNISFEEGEIVYVKDYKTYSKVSWTKVVIKSKVSDMSYVCEVLDNT